MLKIGEVKELVKIYNDNNVAIDNDVMKHIIDIVYSVIQTKPIEPCCYTLMVSMDETAEVDKLKNIFDGIGKQTGQGFDDGMTPTNV